MTRISHKLVGLLFSVVLGCFTIQAQSVFPPKNYPTNDFIHPVDIPFAMVGNYGECRLNHFHAGIDLRTNGEENHHIFAAASGYVSRIKIEPGGYGNALYINHPNGYTTVYAHLNRFREDIEQWVRAEQYRTQSWRQDITLTPNQFLVQQGETIALSGNTGSSEGPHLHFEIRDTRSETPLNPLLFFSQYADSVKPKIRQLAVYDASRSLYAQQPILVHPKEIHSGHYRLNTDTLFVPELTYFGLGIDDFSEKATGTLGVFRLELFVDEQAQFAWQLDSISFEQTRYMNAHADYRLKKNAGQWVQLAHQLPNDRLVMYRDWTGRKGVVHFTPKPYHNIRLDAYDVAGNKTILQFVAAKQKTAGVRSLCSNSVVPGKANSIRTPEFEISFDEKAVYDTVCFSPLRTIKVPAVLPVFSLGNDSIPLHTLMMLRFPLAMPDSLLSYVALVKQDGQANSGQAITVKDAWVQTKLKNFGTYAVVIDKTPPRITSSIKNGDSLREDEGLSFVVEDETTSVTQVTLHVDHQWLRLVQKGKRYYYEPDMYFPPGKHTLRVSATDENNNVITHEYLVERKTK